MPTVFFSQKTSDSLLFRTCSAVASEFKQCECFFFHIESLLSIIRGRKASEQFHLLPRLKLPYLEEHVKLSRTTCSKNTSGPILICSSALLVQYSLQNPDFSIYFQTMHKTLVSTILYPNGDPSTRIRVNSKPRKYFHGYSFRPHVTR